MNEELIERTIDRAKDFFQNEFSGHDFWHTLRVYNNAKAIAEKEECDKEIVCLAALLHDFDDIKITNSTKELENATQWLRANEYSEERINWIKEIINTISFKGTDTKVPKSIEGKIVQDADRLDAIGAIGIARTFAYGGAHGREIWNPNEQYREDMNEEQYRIHKSSSINHFYEKLLKLKNMMNTNTARQMAESRHQYMEEFLKEFYGEWNGNM
ncbi:MAG: HD domain-containing protein [Clostridia bacterium]|nr:HD domain-containing protein [Clostridia bacterium]